MGPLAQDSILAAVIRITAIDTRAAVVVYCRSHSK